MRRLPAVLIALCGILFLGAAGSAPVLPTKGFYINDYASVVFDAHQADILEASTDLYDRTGAQVVVLTTGNLMGMPIEEYGEGIIRGWGIGGAGGEKGVLILLGVAEKQAKVFVGDGLPVLQKYRTAGVNMEDTNLSKSIMNVYRPLMRDAYEMEGIVPGEAIQSALEDVSGESSGPFGGGTIIFFAVLVLVVGRSWRVSRKYRKKYLKGNVRRPKTYARTYNEEDEYNNEKIYRIDYDDRD